jgi:hypothetical protein
LDKFTIYWHNSRMEGGIMADLRLSSLSDPAAAQVVFTSNTTVTLTSTLPLGLYELTTDTVQPSSTWVFNSDSSGFAAFLRGGKGFFQSNGSIISITPPNSGITYPVILNIRLASNYGNNVIYQQIPIDYLIVAGGGGGGGTGDSDYAANGGGGAGGMITGTSSLYAGVTNTITIGAGGAGAKTSNSFISAKGSDSSMSDSIVGSITAIGGGKGQVGYGNVNTGANLPGGSGGGGSAGGAGGPASSGQGNRGGNAYAGYGGAGGGGKGSQGVDSASGEGSGIATKGGDGASSSISGSAVTYAGGGGGGWSPYYQTWVQATNAGGTGGGGQGGGGGANGGQTAGATNRGGGGGAGGARQSSGNSAQNGADGGSGIVIIRYSSTYPAASSTTGSPAISVAGGYRIYQFTGSGSLTI